MPEWLNQLLTSAGIPLIIVGAGYLANRKLGIASGQRTLVEVLQGEVAALQSRDKRREDEFKECKGRLFAVEESERRLKAEVFELRTAYQNLLIKLERPKTRKTRRDDA